MEGSSVGDLAPGRAVRFPALIASAWCGLASGLLEVATIVVRKHTFDPNHLYEMSRHFVWLIPLTNLCLFLAPGAAYVTVALGGFGSLFGALVAGLLIGQVEALTAFLIEPSLKQVGMFAIYLAVLMFRPRGLFGTL